MVCPYPLHRVQLAPPLITTSSCGLNIPVVFPSLGSPFPANGLMNYRPSSMVEGYAKSVFVLLFVRASFLFSFAPIFTFSTSLILCVVCCYEQEILERDIVGQGARPAALHPITPPSSMCKNNPVASCSHVGAAFVVAYRLNDTQFLIYCSPSPSAPFLLESLDYR